jgi:heme O synthase-like polyprenyltransferase
MSAAAPPVNTPSLVRQFNALTKPRVIQLIVFCALIGMVLAVPGAPSWREVSAWCWPAWASGWWRAQRRPSTASSNKASTPR